MSTNICQSCFLTCIHVSPSVSLPAISPAAFVTLFTFVLLAAILIQGPLGIGSVFNSPMPLGFGAPSAANVGQSPMPSLMNTLAKALGTPQAQTQAQAGLASPPIAPQMGGQGQKAGPAGTEQWHWFANPRQRHPPVFRHAADPMMFAVPPFNQPQQAQQAQATSQGVAAGVAQSSQSDAMSYASLPALLQGPLTSRYGQARTSLTLHSSRSAILPDQSRCLRHTTRQCRFERARAIGRPCAWAGQW